MNFKIKPIIISGLAYWIVSFFIQIIAFSLWIFLIPNFIQLYQTAAFRPFNDPATIGLFILPILNGLIFATFYGAIKEKITCNTAFERGTTYGLFLFLVSGIPWLILIYSLFNVQADLIAAWSVELLVRLYIGGAVIAILYEKFSVK